jgi:glycosyltransferase involved in cell wall biosynthesis
MIQFHVLSFEGPDGYARAGGIASRISGMARALADANFETHLWFVGDPHQPGHETLGNLHLHRWCQWISSYHGGGVYDGEYDKADDYARSLPPFLLKEHALPHLSRGGDIVVLAEEWHTAHAVLHLDWLLRQHGQRERVRMMWNANNTFGFNAIDFARLREAATITTVSRYMKYLMRPLGVDPLVIPNGLEPEAYQAPDPSALRELGQQLAGRPLLVKVARFDPDKRWTLAIDTVSLLKERGNRPLLVARGGLEAHGHEVIERARAQGLRISESWVDPGPRGLIEALRHGAQADMLLLRSHVDPEARRVLFRAANAVLANSQHEPFGLVGLEVMAAGGIACTGCSGEDYAVPGQNALVLETNDPQEFVQLFGQLDGETEEDLRSAGRRTADQYSWGRVVERILLPRVGAFGLQDRLQRLTLPPPDPYDFDFTALGPDNGGDMSSAFVPVP